MSAICQSLTFFILIIFIILVTLIIVILIIVILILIILIIVIIRLWLTEDDEADSSPAACIRTVSIVTGYWRQQDYGDTHHHDDDDDQIIFQR